MTLLHQSVVLLGDRSDDYDVESRRDRLAIGLLGKEVQDRWVCRDCMQRDPEARHSCVAYVEHYRGGQGSTFALCDFHLWARLRHEVVR